MGRRREKYFSSKEREKKYESQAVKQNFVGKIDNSTGQITLRPPREEKKHVAGCTKEKKMNLETSSSGKASFS